MLISVEIFDGWLYGKYLCHFRCVFDGCEAKLMDQLMSDCDDSTGENLMWKRNRWSTKALNVQPRNQLEQ